MNNIIICIGTIGRPTFKKCYDLILENYKNHKSVKKIEIISSSLLLLASKILNG